MYGCADTAPDYPVIIPTRPPPITDDGPVAATCLDALAMVGAVEFNIPNWALGKLALLCRGLHHLVQWRLSRAYAVRERWITFFAHRLRYRSIIAQHPIKYTGCRSIIIPFDTMRVSQSAIHPIADIYGDTAASPPDGTVCALKNIWILSKNPVPFMAGLSVYDTPVCALSAYLYDDVGDGALSEGVVRDKYGGVEPGRYAVNLRLPTRCNYIPLAPGIAHPIAVGVTIGAGMTQVDDGEYVEVGISMDLAFIIANFTHMVCVFRTCAEVSHNWADYGIGCAGLNHAYTSSLVRRIDDPDVID